MSELRTDLLDVANSQIGVRELTGRNDGKQVELYQASVKIPKGSAWCVAFVVWCHLQLNPDFSLPITGWSPALFRRNVVYRRDHKRFREWIPRGGECFGKYYSSKKRVAHVGIIESKWSKHLHTIEGNTSLIGAILKQMKLTTVERDKMDRNGIWVAKKIRKMDDVYIASDHVGGAEIRKALRQKNDDKYFKLN